MSRHKLPQLPECQNASNGEYLNRPFVSAHVTQNLLKGPFMSEENTLSVEGFPNISIAAARRVVDALEAHERAEDFALILKEREAYALAVRSSGQYTVGSLISALEALPYEFKHREVRFDFGDSPSPLHMSGNKEDAYVFSFSRSCFLNELLHSLRKIEAPHATLWYRGLANSTFSLAREVSCAISEVSVDGDLVILHTSYVRKSGK